MGITKRPGDRRAGKGLMWQKKAGGGVKLRNAKTLEGEMFKQAAGVEVTLTKNGIPVLEDPRKVELWKQKRETQFEGRLRAVKQLYLERLYELEIDPSRADFVEDLALVIASELLNEKRTLDLYRLFRPKDEIKVRQILFMLTINYLKKEFPRMKSRPVPDRD